MKPVTTAEKISALRREVSMRNKVYPRWVAEGRMKESHARRQIIVMQAVLDDYLRRHEPTLFDDDNKQEGET